MLLVGCVKEFGGESAEEKCKIYFTDEAIKTMPLKCPFVHPTVMLNRLYLITGCDTLKISHWQKICAYGSS